MGRSSSADPLTTADGDVLLDVAEAAAVAAATGAGPVAPSIGDRSPGLRSRVGAFVTITVDGALNGCIGRVEGAEPLIEAVGRLARSAALDDPRLPPLRRRDLVGLGVEVSVLSTPSPFEVDDREGLRAALCAGRDGLVVSCGRHQGVFLPSVWSQLPDPDDFLDQLWAKVGWEPGTWPAGLRAARFTTRRFRRVTVRDGEVSAARRSDSALRRHGRE